MYKVANHVVSKIGFTDFPEPVKSFITFVILSQISWGKVEKPSYFSAHDCVRVSPRFAVVSQITSVTMPNGSNNRISDGCVYAQIRRGLGMHLVTYSNHDTVLFLLIVPIKGRFV